MTEATDDELRELDSLERLRQRRISVSSARFRDRLAEALGMPDGERSDIDEMILAGLDRAIRNRISADVASADKQTSEIMAAIGRRATGAK